MTLPFPCDKLNHIISKGEREREFLEIKENKSCIFNPMGGKRLPWGFAIGCAVRLVGYILSGRANHIPGHNTILKVQQYPAAEPHFYNIFSVVFFAFQPEKIVY